MKKSPLKSAQVALQKEIIRRTNAELRLLQTQMTMIGTESAAAIEKLRTLTGAALTDRFDGNTLQFMKAPVQEPPPK